MILGVPILKHIRVSITILDKFVFQDARTTVKITTAIFRKNFVIALAPSFMEQFFV